jgi:hypothetical protein
MDSGNSMDFNAWANTKPADIIKATLQNGAK